MANLPEEVVVEILSRLPVESLVRFKCVCKSWNALFKNPNFVSQHMKNHQSKDYAIVRRKCPKGTIFSFLASVVEDSGDTVSWVTDWGMDLYSEFRYPARGRTLTMCGHWNGIVAISDYYDDIILCNPAIREFRLLPESSFYPFRQKSSVYAYPEHSNLILADTEALGFGYDPKTDDYKVVRIVNFGLGSTTLPSKAEVFSLHADSTWREISDVVIDTYIRSGYGLEQFSNGIYYWQAEDFTKDEMVLVSFDMIDEVFGRAPLPVCCQRWFAELVTTHLGVYNESIAVFVYPFCKHELCIEVWVMKELGLKEPWIKKLTIGPLIGLERLSVFVKNDEEVLAEDANGRIISYNLATLEPKIVHFYPGVFFWWEAATYRKTLVSVQARRDIVA